MDRLRLKPCPCCGAAAQLREVRAYVYSGWQVKCIQCKLATPGFYINLPATKPGACGPFLDETTRYTSDQAAELAARTWNRRVA